MLQSSEQETEILLGNKQLVAIFFVGVVLLGLAFTGGYMLGRGSASKKAVAPEVAASAPAATDATQPQVGETHSVPGADEGSTAPPPATIPARTAEPAASSNLLGARKSHEPVLAEEKSVKADNFTPQGGQEFLQVAAVPRDHAMAVAAVLRRKGFRAHAVPKPGDNALYRVIVGPIRDAGELSSTRDSLRKTGFSQVIVQRSRRDSCCAQQTWKQMVGKCSDDWSHRHKLPQAARIRVIRAMMYLQAL